VQLTPGDAEDPPPFGKQHPVAFPILLEGASGSVRRPTIELDDQPLLGPQTVDPKETSTNGEVGVQSWPRQSLGIEEGGEPLLQLLVRDAAKRFVADQQLPQQCGSPSPRDDR